jgi:hypothetical protein
MFVDEHDRLRVSRNTYPYGKDTYVYVSLVCGHCHEEQRIGSITHKKSDWVVKVPRKPSRWLSMDRRLRRRGFDTVSEAVAAILVYHKLPPNLFYV